jgi:outer membrane biosynthesis protein TonB
MHSFARRERRDGSRLPPGAVAGSLALHAGLAFFLLVVAPALPTTMPPRSYRVRLVAAADETAPQRLDPAPAEVAEEEHRPPPPQPEVERRPETERPTIVEETPPPDEPAREPARGPEVGEETVNVQLDGAIFPFPEYLTNIIRQVNRYWRPPGGGRAYRAELAFVIQEDGAVTDVEWIRRSGDPTFDLEARGAIEAAGRSLAFGPLPEGYPRDRLRVSFYFDPSRR